MRKKYDYVESINEKLLEKMHNFFSKKDFNKFMENLTIVYQTRKNIDEYNENNKDGDKQTNSLYYLYVEFDKVICEEILNYSDINDRIINRYDVTTKEYKESYDYCKSVFQKFAQNEEQLQYLFDDVNSLEQ